MALITCDNITLAYDSNIVLKDLSFHVEEGEYLCILGENGSGKSTLVRTLLGLRKPASGQITFGDGLTQNEIGYMPQHTEIQKDFPASVWEVVLSGCLNSRGWKPFFGKKEKERAQANMERLSIENIRNRSYRDLSGGQQQRVLLARALCATHKLLLLDEPVAGLDPLVTQELYRIIAEINESGITVLMVSHDIRAAVDAASHILHINNEAQFFGTAEEYRHSELGHRFLCGCRHGKEDAVK